MTLTIEKSLNDFNFWGGAASNAAKLTLEEMDELEEQLEEIDRLNENGPMSVTELNDWFWFDFETICDWLGLDYEEVLARN